MYTMVKTHPNIADTVGLIRKFLSRLGWMHWPVIKPSIKYLHYIGNLNLRNNCDFDIVEVIDPYKSTSGDIFTLDEEVLCGALNFNG